MAKTLLEMAAEIVVAQASKTRMSPEELSETLFKTFDALKKAQAMEEGKDDRGMDPQKSIQRSKVICLECGKDFRQLTNRHLALHGLNSKEYKKKWGIPLRQSLAAKSLTAKRRKMAKERGLGEMLKKARAKKAGKKKRAAKKK
jgi:predicted transcriptional regulator